MKMKKMKMKKKKINIILRKIEIYRNYCSFIKKSRNNSKSGNLMLRILARQQFQIFF